jgi:hypothetical protein
MRSLLLIGLSTLLCSACESLWLEPASDDPVAIFDEAWTFADRRYAFFEFKDVDWDSVRDRYRPMVEDGMSQEALLDVLDDAFYTLRDGHVNIRTPFDRTRNWTWYLDYPQNFDLSLLERNYYNEEQSYIGPFLLMDFGDIGYIRYPSFSVDFSEGQLNYILSRFRDKAGLVIDVRNNGGGSIANINQLAGRFTELPVFTGRQRFRLPEDRNAFGEWSYQVVEPSKEGQRWTKPVVLLTNRSCYSATTMFAQTMRSLPNVTLVGDWTGGGGGVPASTVLANGWTIRVSHTQLESLDGDNLEDGVPPDVRVDMDPDDAAAGIDNILETAFDLLR